MLFEWDEERADANLKKHKVSFKVATTAFSDPFFIAFADPDHSIDENRFILMGESVEGKLLVVSYTERKNATRIISARPATAKERKFYEKGN